MVTLDTGNITNILDEINNDVNLEAHDDGEKSNDSSRWFLLSIRKARANSMDFLGYLNAN